MKRLQLVALLATICAGAARVPSAHAATMYNVIDLGTLGGTSSGLGSGTPISQATAINNSGTVVGVSYTTGNASQHAFSYANGGMMDLGAMSVVGSVANGINASGTVVGTTYRTGASVNAFVYQNGQMTAIGTLYPGHSAGYSYGAAINDQGEVVGNSGFADPGQPDNVPYHAFLDSNGTWTDLGTLGGGSGAMSYATGINDAGQIVGVSDTNPGVGGGAFLWQNGVMTNLGALASGAGSGASGINAEGDIVGSSGVAQINATHAFLYRNGGMIDLGTLGGTWSYGEGINDLDQVVGNSYIAGNNEDDAFLWTNGMMYDMNDLLAPGSTGWNLAYAAAINDDGWVVGYGTNPQGQLEAFLAEPVPEPSSLCLLFVACSVLGAMAAARYRHRKESRSGLANRFAVD
jgi:probable HAF family extracellular repeat protein